MAKNPNNVSESLADGYRSVTPESVEPGFRPQGDAAERDRKHVKECFGDARRSYTDKD